MNCEIFFERPKWGEVGNVVVRHNGRTIEVFPVQEFEAVATLNALRDEHAKLHTPEPPKQKKESAAPKQKKEPKDSAA